ncbi:MAG: hypothetical protein SFV54_17705 [Bryobacteraceae bacterium]|nr:hypothetical protein [Bryobacteraceae bacterium]
MGWLRRGPRNDREAVERLIADINTLDRVKNAVFHRIWLIFAIVWPLAVLLFVMVAVKG